MECDSRLRRRLLSSNDWRCPGRRRRSPPRPRSCSRRRRRRGGRAAPARCGQQVVRPLDRRPQCLLSRVGVALPLEQVETLGEACEELLRSEERGTGGGELERERRLVEPHAEAPDRIAFVERGIDGAGARRSSATPSSCARRNRAMSARRELVSAPAVTRTSRCGHAARSSATAGAASTTCSKLSKRTSMRLSAMCAARSFLAPRTRDAVSRTSGASRREAKRYPPHTFAITVRSFGRRLEGQARLAGPPGPVRSRR